MSNPCQMKANWTQIGKTVYTLPKFAYRVPVTPETRYVEHLGAVKGRSDGRWDWWRFKSTFHKDWITGQGVADTKAWAQIRVLEGWDVPTEIES